MAVFAYARAEQRPSDARIAAAVPPLSFIPNISEAESYIETSQQCFSIHEKMQNALLLYSFAVK
jgi:hypothetical protein